VIDIEVDKAPDGCLVAMRMTGHAGVSGGPRGGNIVCAAVTGVVRSCAEAITGADGIAVSGVADREGELSLLIREVDESRRDWLRGVTDVLLTGVRRIAAETPDEVALHERG